MCSTLLHNANYLFPKRLSINNIFRQTLRCQIFPLYSIPLSISHYLSVYRKFTSLSVLRIYKDTQVHDHYGVINH